MKNVKEAVICSWHPVERKGRTEYSGFAHIQPENTGLGSVFIISEQFIDADAVQTVKLGSRIVCEIGPRSSGKSSPMALNIDVSE